MDDLSYIGLDLGASDDASSTEELGGRANDVDIVGLEEQIEREENSEEKMESTRIRMQATRSAVHEALVLWSSKADLLQVDKNGDDGCLFVHGYYIVRQKWDFIRITAGTLARC